jgi:type IV pilus assembly protein PilC
MPTYHYSAKDVTGRMVTGDFSASSRFEALSQLHAKGLTVTDISDDDPRLGQREGNSRASLSTGLFSRRITLSEKSVFCRQLSISVEAGVPLRDAFENIAVDMDNPTFGIVLARVMKRLDDGMTMSQAISPESRVFDRLFVALIKAAEESGSITETLKYLALSMERADKLGRKIKSLIAYPIFVGFFFIVVSLIMTVFVLPKFQTIFSSFGGRLPKLTQVVFQINTFIVSNSALIFLVLAAIIVLVVLYCRTPVGRLQRDSLLLRMPVVGPIIRKVSVARFCRNLGIMVKGGVPVTTAIEIATEILGNKAMESTLKATRERIMSGGDIAGSLDPKTFPRLVVRMVGVGEQSGRLPDVLDKVADLYEDQAEGAMMIATALFEPLIIIVFGCMILVLVMAVYLPVFSAASVMR